jgi:cell division control protein 45
LNSAFGLAFQTTAEATGARIKLDTFDANVMEIKREDLVTFMENLKHSL